MKKEINLNEPQKQALNIPVVSSRFIRQEAKKQIYKCKESCYGKKTDASNVSEGDYGRWTDWEDVLVKFAKHILKNGC